MSAKTPNADASPSSEVYRFWNTEPCGTHFVTGQPASPEFFKQYRAFRDATEWHIPKLVPFASTKGQRVLEIGCGNGADGVRFGLAGADYTGTDLTDAAVEATRAHYASLGLIGKFQKENAEHLSFADDCFDFVYSHGVLHHTPHPEKAFDEIYRVLKPGGRAVLMLYHRNSFNYYVRIMGYMRARVLMGVASRTGRWKADRRGLKDGIKGVRGNENSSVWQIHYHNFLRQGWSYLSARNFVHHATDGPECPYAFVYGRREVQTIFRKFHTVDSKVAHFPLKKYWKGIPRAFENAVAQTFGWYLFIYLAK